MNKYDEYIDIITNDKESRDILREACKFSFLQYLQSVFYIINGTSFLLKPFHRLVINKLESLVLGNNTKRNLALCLPVGSGKSLITEYFITWCFARSVNCTFCYTSHSDRLINKLSKECKDIIENEYWQLLFNHPLKKDDRQRVNFSFEGAKNRTGLTAGTTGGAITGLDAGNPNIEGFSGALIIDDPMDAGNGRYESAREEVVTYYDEKLSTRRRTPQTPTILIMQRLHLDDLVGWIEKNEADLWDIVKVPALSEDNKSFWEERYPVKELEHIRSVNNFKFQSQYQQEPIAAGGAVIQIDWFRYYPSSEIPNTKYKAIYITGDTAQKVKEHNDYSVFFVWGITQTGKLRRLDWIRGKWEAPELKRQVKMLWQRWADGINWMPCSGIYIEDKSSGTGLIQELSAETAIPVIPLQADKDKLTRLEAVLSHIEAGNVELADNPECNKELLDECEAFTRDDSHKHDDQVDTLVYGIMVGLSHFKASILDLELY